MFFIIIQQIGKYEQRIGHEKQYYSVINQRLKKHNVKYFAKKMQIRGIKRIVESLEFKGERIFERSNNRAIEKPRFYKKKVQGWQMTQKNAIFAR